MKSSIISLKRKIENANTRRMVCMSNHKNHKLRVLEVGRAIIVGQHLGRSEYFLIQRAQDAKRHPRFWECVGGTCKPGMGSKYSQTIVCETMEEIGIPITRIVREVCTVERDWEKLGQDDTEFDRYIAKFFLVEVPKIEVVKLSAEHSGHAWFEMPAIKVLKPIVRPSTYAAFHELTGIALPSEIPQLVPVRTDHR